MPINRPRQTKYSEQNIANNSYDEDFDVSAFEMLGYDPLAEGGQGALKRVTTNALGEYQPNNIAESGTITYIGYEDADGDWFIKRLDTASGTEIRFATVNNNVSTTDYSTAWTNRADLTYNTYGTAF